MPLQRSVLILLFSLGLTSTSPGLTASNLVELISTASYSNHLANLYTHIGESRGFTDGPSPRTPAFQHDLARDYIHSNLTAWGYDTWLDPFDFDVDFTYDTDPATYHYEGCNNIVATKWGHGGSNVFFLIAHYDSVDRGHRNVTAGPGADDGASGVAAQLEIAEVIKDYLFKDTIVILVCDAEEKDYQGAAHFCANHITENPAETNTTIFLKSTIKAVVNLDSIAYDDTNTPRHVVMGYVDTLSPVALAVGSSIAKHAPLTTFSSPGFYQSDHIAFHNIGIDAIHVIEYDFRDYWGETNMVENPYYHTDYDAIDQPGYLNLDYAADVTRGLVGAICDYASPILPATLTPSVSNQFAVISWMASPDVAYELYGTSDLTSNSWNLVTHVAATNTEMNRTVELDLNTVTQRMFHVLSK